jgi:hypothetical protein
MLDRNPHQLTETLHTTRTVNQHGKTLPGRNQLLNRV